MTDRTREEIRHYWTMYLQYEGLSKKQRKTRLQTFKKNIDAKRKTIVGYEAAGGSQPTAHNSAGPLALNFIDIDYKLFEDMWDRGYTRGTAPIEAPYHPNETFAYTRSGYEFTVYHDCQPAQSFHLAAITASEPSTPRKVIDDIRRQFAIWSTALRLRIALPKPRFRIRLVVADALAAGHALRHCNRTGDPRTGVYMNAWSGYKLDFVEEDYHKDALSRAPTTFNVIDTSTIADRLGFMNVLVISLPLLRDIPSAVIHSEPAAGKKRTLFNLMCGDAIGLGTLLGVLPLQAMSHFTSIYSRHDGLVVAKLFQDKNLVPLDEPISWRRPVLPLPTGQQSAPQRSGVFSDTGRYTFTCDPEELGDVLYSFYLRMFREESYTYDMSTYGSGNVIRYCRESLVCFLALVKEQTTMDWDVTMKRFLEKVKADTKLASGAYYFQDLLCQLHLRDVYDLPALSIAEQCRARVKNPHFRGWTEIPPVVCVILRVPRIETQPMEGISSSSTSSPILECHTFGPDFYNCHSSIQAIAGTLSTPTAHDASDLVLHVDPQGRSSKSSDLIVSFYLPTAIFLEHPEGFKLALNTRLPPRLMPTIRQIPPSTFKVFNTNSLDSEHVILAPHRPGNARELEMLHSPFLPPQTNVAPDSPAMLKFDAKKTTVEAVAIRHQVRKPEDRKVLLEGAAVSMDPASDFVLKMNFAKYAHRFNYPCPVRGGQSKVRIARKSHYIEIESPLRRDFQHAMNLSMNPFLAVSRPDAVHLLNIHHVNLDRCPAVPLPLDPHSTWLTSHLGMMYSYQENSVRADAEKSNGLILGPLVSLKQSINDLILGYCMASTVTFVVTTDSPKPNTPYALMVGNGIRFDDGSHNVIADLCVIPIRGRSEDLNKACDELLMKIAKRRNPTVPVIDLAVSTVEEPLWDMFLVCGAERCRNWSHTAACEYKMEAGRGHGGPTVILKGATRPLCRCGKGKNVDVLKKTMWVAWSSEAYRVAISPLYALSRLGSEKDGEEDDGGANGPDFKNLKILNFNFLGPQGYSLGNGDVLLANLLKNLN